ncbi:hypothetical protein ABZ671_16810 [Micromonospora sp. NPDC006766]|uniref:hypothetical protein n=1 Tax=Micromonospora sp. NPDC006766 TaxID=3154778 RepID=UPI0033EB6318
MKRRIDRLLRQLDVDLPAPLTVQGLVSALEAARGRRVQLVAMTIVQSGPCGLLVATPEADYVLYTRDASRVLQVQTILHELMHIGLRHTGGTVLPVGRVAAAFDDVGPEVVLARSPSTFGEQQEHEAELLATYLGARLVGGDQVGAFDDLGDATAAVMHRIAATLAD